MKTEAGPSSKRSAFELGERRRRRGGDRLKGQEVGGWSARATAMGEAACSPSCAGRLCGRQLCATVLVVQEVHHHRHQRLRRHLPPKKQRLLPTLTWQMSVMPATKPEIQGPAEGERRISTNRRRKERALRNSATSPPEGDRPPPSPPTPGSTFTPRKRFPLWYTIARRDPFFSSRLRSFFFLRRVSSLIRSPRIYLPPFPRPLYDRSDIIQEIYLARCIEFATIQLAMIRLCCK